jgi:hypothetical protein
MSADTGGEREKKAVCVWTETELNVALCTERFVRCVCIELTAGTGGDMEEKAGCALELTADVRLRYARNVLCGTVFTGRDSWHGRETR